MSISKLFSEKCWLDGIKYAYCPALVLIKKDGTKVEYSWTEYKKKALQTMEGLKWRELKAGEFVAVIGLNLPESFFAMLGAILMGAVPVPINVMLLKEAGHKELKKIVDDCKPGLVLGNGCLKKILPEYCISIEQIIEEGKKCLDKRRPTGNPWTYPNIPANQRDPNEILLMPYTSGTTGKPKGVMLSEAAVLDRVSAMMTEFKVTD
ncbi:MAG: AMP-binding protein, partial [Candidatus Taylorbacteria bacterium]|nr:AMP-binding protein [Candidatus Taylorbacteria bacterium]